MTQTATHPGTGQTTYDHSNSETTETYKAHRRERALADTDLRPDHYGGMHWGAALYGWLVSTGISTILITILAAGGAIALGANSIAANVRSLNASTTTAIGLAGGVALLVVLTIAAFAGGYVAGRLARFDGARQGVGSWFVSLLIALVLGSLVSILVTQYNVLQRISLAHLPISANLTKDSLIASAVVLVVTLVAAVLGGQTGEHYHAKIDAGGTDALHT